MPQKILMMGNEAAGAGAILAHCDAYFGYPITPQNEFTAYMARRMPEEDRIFIQAESELAAISMVYGAAATGKRAMTSSSSPGVSLMQEGISYIAGSRLPAVVVNVQRGGPGLGGIGPSQADYWQATRGGGHGDYRTIVLAPASAQEMLLLTAKAFHLADRYRMVCVVVADAYLGQMMEPVVVPDEPFPAPPPKPWAVTGCKGREPNTIKSLYLIEAELDQANYLLHQTCDAIAREETQCELVAVDDAQLVLVAYGISARVCREAVAVGRQRGLKLGLLRPITLFPFPTHAIQALAERPVAFLSVEMSMGQMVDDVRLAVGGRRAVEHFGRPATLVDAEEILDRASHLIAASQP